MWCNPTEQHRKKRTCFCIVFLFLFCIVFVLYACIPRPETQRKEKERWRLWRGREKGKKAKPLSYLTNSEEMLQNWTPLNRSTNPELNWNELNWNGSFNCAVSEIHLNKAVAHRFVSEHFNTSFSVNEYHSTIVSKNELCWQYFGVGWGAFPQH